MGESGSTAGPYVPLSTRTQVRRMSSRELPKELRQLYFPRAGPPCLVDVPAMKYLMVDGAGDPNTSKEFREAIESLYGLAYTLKFGSKRPGVRKAPVMPLEGLYWTEDGEGFVPSHKEAWHWTLMLKVPEALRASDVASAVRTLRQKKNPAALGRVRFERWKEGRAVEVLYVGPYSGETSAINSLHEFAEKEGYRIAGRHHEIYLGDPRRSKPERLKTVLRQPVARPLAIERGRF